MLNIEWCQLPFFLLSLTLRDVLMTSLPIRYHITHPSFFLFFAAWIHIHSEDMNYPNTFAVENHTFTKTSTIELMKRKTKLPGWSDIMQARIITAKLKPYSSLGDKSLVKTTIHFGSSSFQFLKTIISKFFRAISSFTNKMLFLVF